MADSINHVNDNLIDTVPPIGVEKAGAQWAAPLDEVGGSEMGRYRPGTQVT